MLTVMNATRWVQTGLGAGLLALACGICAAPVPVAATTALAEPSASARDLFARNKSRLLQVRVLLSSASEQSSLGSGFLVQNQGDSGAWVVTNYHVVSSLAIDPAKYRIELRSTNERTVRAELMAVDVIHDLAVLRIEPDTQSTPWPSFVLRESPLTQGSKVFSLGNPLELGFLISEGIYNGLVESRLYDQMLFSGALNSGMSGGPAIDENGAVVGVNVATRRDGQQLAFLVPVQYVRSLMQLALTGKPRTEWRSEIARQLAVHQAFMVSKILATPAQAAVATTDTPRAGFGSQSLAGRKVPTLDGSLTKCWATAAVVEKPRYQSDTLDCTLHAELYVSPQVYSGTMNLRHVLLRNEKLSTAQFLKLSAASPNPAMPLGGNDRTRSECQGNFVQGAVHPYRVSMCVRGYKKFDGVYDVTLKAVQVDDDQERLTSTLSLRGFSFDNAQRLSAQFLGLLQ